MDRDCAGTIGRGGRPRPVQDPGPDPPQRGGRGRRHRARYCSTGGSVVYSPRHAERGRRGRQVRRLGPHPPEDIAAAVEVVVGQRAEGLRPVVVVSAFEGVTDAILLGSRAAPRWGRLAARRWAHAPDSALARETDRALATGEALSAALFALGLQARACRRARSAARRPGSAPPRPIWGPPCGGCTRPLRDRGRRAGAGGGRLPGHRGSWRADHARPGRHRPVAVALAVALRADRCELFKDVGGVWEADPHLVPAARLLPTVSALQLELLGELGAEVCPVAVAGAPRTVAAGRPPRWTTAPPEVVPRPARDDPGS